MRAVIQRVAEASVCVDGQPVGAIETGLLALIGVAPTDTAQDATRLATKIMGLRLFPGAGGAFDRSLSDGAGALLVVSQFTLYGTTRKGRRPGWSGAAAPEHAAPLIEQLIQYVRAAGIATACGSFGAAMDVRLLNSGPVTLILDTDEWSHGRG